MTWGRTCLRALVCLLGTVAAAGAQTAIDLDLVVNGLERPVFVGNAGDGSRRLFVIEQPGRIRILAHGARLARPFLNPIRTSR